MTECLMFIGIGFLSACLITLIVTPHVHDRAVRLTASRLERANPLVTEILAKKDQQRAEYAIYTARLEATLRYMSDRNAGIAAELGRKNGQLNRLKIELSDHADAIAVLRRALSERLLAERLASGAEDDLAAA